MPSAWQHLAPAPNAQHRAIIGRALGTWLPANRMPRFTHHWAAPISARSVASTRRSALIVIAAPAGTRGRGGGFSIQHVRRETFKIIDEMFVLNDPHVTKSARGWRPNLTRTSSTSGPMRASIPSGRSAWNCCARRVSAAGFGIESGASTCATARKNPWITMISSASYAPSRKPTSR